MHEQSPDWWTWTQKVIVLCNERVHDRTAHYIAWTGTNINEALLRAIFILNEANNLGLLDPNSVSLIILVSDGDPTVGKYRFDFLLTNIFTVVSWERDLLETGNLIAFAWVSKLF